MSLPWFRPSCAITRAIPLTGNTRPHCEGIRCEGTLLLTKGSYPRFPLSQFIRADTSWNESVSSVTTRRTGGTLLQACTDMHPGRHSSNFSPIVDLFLLTSSPSNTRRCPVPHANILATWVLARTLCFRPVAWQGLRHAMPVGATECLAMELGQSNVSGGCSCCCGHQVCQNRPFRPLHSLHVIYTDHISFTGASTICQPFPRSESRYGSQRRYQHIASNHAYIAIVHRMALEKRSNTRALN